MGMSGGGGGKGAVSSEINVTPLIDVLLVLLIIFLVVMPIMMKKETLTVPRKLEESTEKPDDTLVLLNVKLRADAMIEFTDQNTVTPEVFQSPQLADFLRPRIKLIKEGSEKVVFVDFEDGVKWEAVVATMDKIRSLATDADKDEVKVALTVCDADKRKPAGCEKPQ